VGGLRRRYERVLERLADRPRSVLAVVGVLCTLAVLALPFFGGAFLPEFREGHFIVHMAAAPGTSLEESVRLGQAVTRALLKNPHIRSVAQQIGRAEQFEDTRGARTTASWHVDLQPLSGEEAEAVQSEIRAALAQFPGLYFAIKPFLTERIEETISGVTAQVVVKIFGDDLDVLDAKAREVAAVLGRIDGAADVQVQSPPGAPQLVVRLRRDRLQQFGFQPVEVLEAVETAYQGAVAAQLYDGNRVFDVAVLLDPALRREPEGVGALLVPNRAGVRLPSRELAAVDTTTGRYAVLHDGARRQQAVSCNVGGRDLALFVADAKQKIAADVNFPAGTYAVFTGAAEAQAQAQRELAFHSLLAAAGIVLWCCARDRWDSRSATSPWS
jgi:Cu/Ag efflux pump CusA